MSDHRAPCPWCGRPHPDYTRPIPAWERDPTTPTPAEPASRDYVVFSTLAVTACVVGMALITLACALLKASGFRLSP